MNDSTTLVAGATGQLGSAIVGHLVAAGMRVRALARSPERLAALAPGAEISATDMLDLRALTKACQGVEQIIATANNNMRTGAQGPGRTDLTAYQNLLAAARTAGVRRLVYVSYKGVSQDAPVDIFRIKWMIEDAIRRSGVPYVMLRPSAFMDVWIDQIFEKDMREKRVATIFGDGSSVNNYIAVDDVARFARRILEQATVVNEAIDVCGPSNLSQNELVALIERRLGHVSKRRHIPVAALRLLPPLVRPFNELAARLMTLGFYVATEAAPCHDGKKASDRFGVEPRTVDAYLDGRPAR